MAGTQERPRLAIFRSLKHIYAQVIDDQQGHTLAAAASTEKDLRGKGGNVEGAKLIGQAGRRACQRQRHYPRGVRSRRISVSWPRQGAGRCGTSKRDWSFNRMAANATAKRIDAQNLNLKEQVV